MRSVKLSLAAMVAVGALAALVSVASARTLSFSSQTFRTTFPNVEYTNGAFGGVRCALTLEGTLHARNVAKTAGLLVGYITRASHAAACGQGSAIVLAETLPWHVRYRSFAGTLPNITSVGLDIVEYAVSLREQLGILCAVRSTAAEPVTLTLTREAGGALTSARIGGTPPSSCGFGITLAGTSNTLTVLNSTTAITVTLI